jgi:Family of unknown function (DUF6223)
MPDAFTLTSDRLLATAAALLAVFGTIIGVLALLRAAGRTRERLATTAVAAGLPGALAGVLVVATADGGPGTGNGVVGGYAAIALGLIAIGLGLLTLTRAGNRAL